MKYLYLFSLFIFCFCQSPNGLKKKKNISEVQEISLDNNFQIYIPKKNSFVDSITQSVNELRDLKISIEDLTKLNPNGIESFLDEDEYYIIGEWRKNYLSFMYNKWISQFLD